jgi:putative membrane protein
MTKLLPAAVAVAAFAAGPLSAQAMTPTEYVATAGASDLYEIQSSQTVLKTTQDAKVRAFAQQMIADHTKSTAQVKAAAARSKVKAPPPMLNPLQAELVAELNGESGPARDARYIAEQKASHNQALFVQKAYAMDGTAPALKTAASGIVPVVQSHVEMLKTM